MAEGVEEIFKKLQSHKGVKAVLVVNENGMPIRSTCDNALTVHYAAVIHPFVKNVKSAIKDMDMSNDVSFIRVRSKKNEIMIAPEKEYIMVTIQEPQACP